MVSTTTLPRDEQEEHDTQTRHEEEHTQTHNTSLQLQSPIIAPRLPISPLPFPSQTQHEGDGEPPSNIYTAAANVASAIDKLLNTLNSDRPRSLDKRTTFQDIPGR
eukprot:TRINITY_DN6481_c0_g2_i1.p1 TRINITY_DN6481_c0_g2~~TRINITY_DN6481_c0_g2_i1.p1  ORF type:complete len:124 (+),score=36.59 TRINITY_DN6481_c0_g2_i1:57-374(+)